MSKLTRICNSMVVEAKSYLTAPIEWARGEDPEYPYEAEHKGHKLLVRLNDFPEAELYALIADGEEITNFDDWPTSWNRPGDSEESLIPQVSPLNESRHAQDKRSLFERDLIESHDLIYRTVLGWNHDEAETENLVQEAYMRTFQYMEECQWTVEISNIAAFVIRIARSLQNDRWRRGVRTESLDDKSLSEQIVQEIQSNPPADIEKRIYLEQLIQTIPFQIILRGLSDYELQILHLAAVEGLSTAEIAEKVGENIASLRYDLQKVESKVRSRARRYLKEKGTKRPF